MFVSRTKIITLSEDQYNLLESIITQYKENLFDDFSKWSKDASIVNSGDEETEQKRKEYANKIATLLGLEFSVFGFSKSIMEVQ